MTSKVKTNIKRGFQIFGIVFLVALPIVANAILGDPNIYNAINAETTKPINFSKPSSKTQDGQKLAEEIVAEAATLVKNDNNCLPFDKDDKKVNIFGLASYNWTFGGSGSGRVSPESGTDYASRVNFVKAFKNYGVEVNESLSSYYEGIYNSYVKDDAKKFYMHSGDDMGQVVATLNRRVDKYYVLTEPGISGISASIKSEAKSFSNNAIVVLSRHSGECFDCPTVQYKLSDTDNSRHYLQISTEEEALLKYVGENFQNVCVVINSTNTMQLDFLKTIPGLDSCVVIGPTGNRGVNGLPKLFYGEQNFSGRLVDTIPYNFRNNPSYWYVGKNTSLNYYTNYGSCWPQSSDHRTLNSTISLKYPEYTDQSSTSYWSYPKAPYFYDYVEGIYVGYKWYETAWKEGLFENYYNEVQFPFGMGLNNGNFEWTIDSVNPAIGSNITLNTKFEIKMTCKNVGQISGKDVMQLYLTAPYTPGGIEKSYVSLVDFAKPTCILEPGESEQITLSFSAYDIASYDCYDKNRNGFTTYELDPGTYEFKFMANSHEFANNINFDSSLVKLTAKASDSNNKILNYKIGGNALAFTNDPDTNKPIKNLFTGDNTIDEYPVDAIMSESNQSQSINYLSRATMKNYVAPTGLPAKRALPTKAQKYNQFEKSEATAWDNAAIDEFGNQVDNSPVRWGSKSGTKLWNISGVTEEGFKLGQNYNDPLWENVLDQVTRAEAEAISTSTKIIAKVDSVGKAQETDVDGPAQGGGFQPSFTTRTTGFPSETTLASTFNKNLARRLGMVFGKECSGLIDGLYGPACNIHRSPFGGRNYEYPSEDTTLASAIAGNYVNGLQNAGVYVYYKHLILAEQETGREANYTWISEQALREVYARPFRDAIVKYNVSGLMTSYNRIGACWTGGSVALIKGLIRGEWGFNGQIITDYSNSKNFMTMTHGLRAGGDIGMANTINEGVDGTSYPVNSNRFNHALRDAVHHILYAKLSVAYQNQQYNLNPDDGTINKVGSFREWMWLDPTIIAINILSFSGAAIIGICFSLGLYQSFKENKTQKKSRTKK